MKRAIFCKETSMGLDVIPMDNKTIVLPFDETTYAELINDKTTYKAVVNAYIAAHPELFPDSIRDGWSLHGFTKESAKQGIRIRRILTKADGEVWQLRPAFVMPYMTCDTATAEQILFLSEWTPDWALARVFKLDAMTVYRVKTHMGRYNIVGTTVKKAEMLPKDLVADEKQTRISGDKVSLATTAAKQCFLGASLALKAGEDELTEAYQQFKHEARQVDAAYQPDTVNTDGWQATMNAWRTLFPTICLIRCFLHAVLSIRNVATTATKTLYDQIAEQAWHVYKAGTKRSFSQRVRRLREWGATLADSPLKSKLQKLCEKKAGFLPAYDFPQGLRTSNMIDRLMQRLDKYLLAKQYFHGTLASAERGIRAYCLLSNFRPYAYNPTAGYKDSQTRSSFEQLNGFRYHDCWLQNMLVATSRQEIYRFQHKKI